MASKHYYIPDPLGVNFFEYNPKKSSNEFKRQVIRGLVHETKEAAIAHAKVMLGVSDE